jgi:hypothetical protein
MTLTRRRAADISHARSHEDRARRIELPDLRERIAFRLVTVAEQAVAQALDGPAPAEAS